MSRHVRVLFPVVLAMVLLSGCFGCEDEETVFPNTVFFVPVDPLTMAVGDSKTVTATTLPFSTSSGKVDLGTTTYSSSDPSIATVDPNTGKVTCVAPGSATIIATNVNKAGSSRGTKVVTCVGVTPPPSAPPGTGTLFIVSPTTLTFNHTVGTTGCPQSIGPVHVQTQGNEAVTVTATVTATTAINVSPTTLVLSPNGGADMAVNFNCTTQTNFTGNIVVNATSPTRSSSLTVLVVSNIK